MQRSCNNEIRELDRYTSCVDSRQTPVKFDYFYGAESEQFSFYRVPKILIKDERFKGVSSDAKLLYGLMLDRMSLSIKNGWFDKENRAYIYYTVEDIAEDLGCSKGTCTKIVSELDSKNGIGLIEKKRQGLGKPDIIYVKKFTTIFNNEKVIIKKRSNENADSFAEVQKLNFKKSNNCFFGDSKNKFAENQEMGTNYNDLNNNKSSNNQSIHHTEGKKEDIRIEKERWIDVMEKVKENIEYDYLMNNIKESDIGLVEELYGLICEVMLTEDITIKVGGKILPCGHVKEQFFRLRSEHIEYVMDSMKKITGSITNIKAYMLVALYNAVNTFNHYVQQEVQHDMFGDGWKEKGIAFY